MRLIIPFLLVILTMSFISSYRDTADHNTVDKMNGISFVAPRNPVGDTVFTPIVDLNANWIAITPYAFTRKGSAVVQYSKKSRWWGEGIEGAIATIQMAQSKGLNVMLKPHVWVQGQGWAGDFNPKNDKDWIDWENSYSNYILTFAQVADSMNVPLLCIGTEYRHAVKERPEYWVSLIKKIRAGYSGKLTYAANWDNYNYVTFWPKLDYIGIDAYFPLAKTKTPTVNELVISWEPIKEEIRLISASHSRPVLFTEFGFESIDYATSGHWSLNKDTLGVNQMAQANGFSSVFNSFWDESWFAGGFVWKWHARHRELGNSISKEFSPQNKLAEGAIRDHFKQKSPDQN